MKKQLLTTTALVAAGAFAAAAPASAADMKAPVKLAVKGYMQYIIGMPFDKDKAPGGPNVPSVDNHMESEIWFKGTAKLDNGITIHADTEFEVIGSGGAETVRGLEGGGTAQVGSDELVDETSMDIRGSFGQFTLGQKDNAGNQMTTGYAGSWATNVGQNIAFDRHDWVALPSGLHNGLRFNGALNDVRLRSGGENDSLQITYFTPRFEGVQLGFSYIPAYRHGPGDGLGTAGADTSSKYHNGFAAGINYNGKFDGMGLGLAAGYLTASAPTSWTGSEDMSAYVIAARADFGPFRVAAAFKENKDTGAGGSLDGRMYDVGARYKFGPNAVSVAYTSGSIQGSAADPDDFEDDGAAIAYRRALGPGVFWQGTLLYSDFKSETEDPATGMRNTNDGWAATTSVLLVF